ncbi:MAG: HAD hydrolase-like protein [bacterium]|nr:HAD hydrolase-like protein [bacterium]
MRSAVVFDCDGVLFDSWDANVAYYNAIRSALGLGPMEASLEAAAHVLSGPEVIERMFADDPTRLERARELGRTIDYTPFYALMAPAAGLFDVLGTLRGSHRLGMATNRGRTVTGVVEHFGLGAFLDAAVGIEDVPRPKPHPDVITECLVRLGVAPAAALYVGDARGDLLAAEAAGVAFVAVGDAPWSPARLATLAELPAFVAGLGLGSG